MALYFKFETWQFFEITFDYIKYTMTCIFIFTMIKGYLTNSIHCVLMYPKPTDSLNDDMLKCRFLSKNRYEWKRKYEKFCHQVGPN